MRLSVKRSSLGTLISDLTANGAVKVTVSANTFNDAFPSVEDLFNVQLSRRQVRKLAHNITQAELEARYK